MNFTRLFNTSRLFARRFHGSRILRNEAEFGGEGQNKFQQTVSKVTPGDGSQKAFAALNGLLAAVLLLHMKHTNDQMTQIENRDIKRNSDSEQRLDNTIGKSEQHIIRTEAHVNNNAAQITELTKMIYQIHGSEQATNAKFDTVKENVNRVEQRVALTYHTACHTQTLLR